MNSTGFQFWLLIPQIIGAIFSITVIGLFFFRKKEERDEVRVKDQDFTQEEWENELKKRREGFYFWIGMLYLVACVIAAEFLPFIFEIGKTQFNLGVVLLLIIIAHFIMSFTKMEADQRASIRFFGENVVEARPGLVFVPLFICELRTYSKKINRLEIGTPLTISGGKERAQLGTIEEERTYVLDEPFRVTFPGKEPSKKSEKERREIEREFQPLERSMTIDPHVQIRWRVERAIPFDERVGDIDAANRLLESEIKATLNSIPQKYPTVKEMIVNIENVEKELLTRLEWLMGEPGKEAPQGVKEKGAKLWMGVNILRAGITTPGLPQTLNEALRNSASKAAESEGRMQEIINIGIGEAEAIRRKGLATAQAREALLAAEALGAELIAIALEKRDDIGKLVLWVQTIRDALEKAQYSIVPGTEIFGAVAGIQEMLKKIGGKTQESVLLQK